MGNDCIEICYDSQPVECCDYAQKTRGGCCCNDGGNRIDDLQEYIFENSIDMDEMADASTAADHYKMALCTYLELIMDFRDKMRHYKRALHRAISEKNLEDANLYYNRINLLEETLQNAGYTPESITANAVNWKKAYDAFEEARQATENQCPLAQGCCMKG